MGPRDRTGFLQREGQGVLERFQRCAALRVATEDEWVRVPLIFKAQGTIERDHEWPELQRCRRLLGGSMRAVGQGAARAESMQAHMQIQGGETVAMQVVTRFDFILAADNRRLGSRARLEGEDQLSSFFFAGNPLHPTMA